VTVHVRPENGTALSVALRRADGTPLGGSSGGGGEAVLERHLGRGRYVLTVTAAAGSKPGGYKVWRAARVITALQLFRLGGPLYLGQAATLGLQVSPGESGRATVDIERLDPATGWHFDRRLKTRISGGRGVVSFVPRTQGRWRARAAFAQTRRAQASETTRTLHFDVVTPLKG
jgi:hypothetical protein